MARRAVRRGFPRPLPDAQVAVLRTVVAAPGIGTAAVAERLQVAPDTVSTLVGELVAAGLIVRSRSETDRRATHLALTDRARADLAMWGEHLDRVLRAALEQLAADERAALAAALPAVRHLLEVLERDQGPGRQPGRAARPAAGSAAARLRSQDTRTDGERHDGHDRLLDDGDREGAQHLPAQRC